MTKVFVFGSNEAGRHGKGAALFAKRNRGAKQGIGVGPQGNSYAIPTKNLRMKSLPLDIIEIYVGSFLTYARTHPELLFEVTPIGCGLAGYQEHQIKPFFATAPSNCHLPTGW